MTHSVPTRHSSDLRNLAFKLNSPPSQDCVNNSGSRHHRFADIALPHRATRHLKHAVKALLGGQAEPLVHLDARLQVAQREIQLLRSEEHTSELQSLMRISYAVFCLKKKKHSI